MKKIFALFLTWAVLCLSLAGCSGNSTKITDNANGSNPLAQEPQSGGRDNADTTVENSSIENIDLAVVAEKEGTQKLPHEVKFNGGEAGSIELLHYGSKTGQQ